MYRIPDAPWQLKKLPCSAQHRQFKINYKRRFWFASRAQQAFDEAPAAGPGIVTSAGPGLPDHYDHPTNLKAISGSAPHQQTHIILLALYAIDFLD
jgi:hypothetical protein